MAYTGSYSLPRIIRLFLSLVSWLFSPLRFFVDAKTHLHVTGAGFVLDPVADRRRALPFIGFITRVRSHRLFYGGMGFVPEWSI